MLCGYFKKEIPLGVDGKRDLLLCNKVALWDIATACEIEGSADATLKNADVADLSEIFNKAKIEKILLNGTLAYQLFLQKYEGIDIPYEKMPSTSPANPRYKEEIWHDALDSVFAK